MAKSHHLQLLALLLYHMIIKCYIPVSYTHLQHLKQINKCLQSSLSLKGTNLSLKEAIENNIELQQLMEDYDDIKKVVEIAAVIQGIPRNISTHAAGIVITK